MTGERTHDEPAAPALIEAPPAAEPEAPDAAAALAEEQTKTEPAKEAETRGLPTTGTKAELAERIAADDARPEREPFFQGYYTSEVAIYGCPHCFFTYRSSGEVMWHIRGNHPDQGGND